MKFSDLVIGQIFQIVKDNNPLPMRFRKTEIHGDHNCVSLWKENQECKAHCPLNQEIILNEEP